MSRKQKLLDCLAQLRRKMKTWSDTLYRAAKF